MHNYLLQIDSKARCISVFNSLTGFYVRSGEIRFAGTDEDFKLAMNKIVELVETKLDTEFIKFFMQVASGQLDKNKKLAPLVAWLKGGDDPFRASYPQLIDVGIMGSCQHGRNGLCRLAGVECYQDGLHTHKPDMTLDDFKRIVDESKGKVYQIALGGRGDPNKHKQFREICEYCRANDIAPNYTTSGLALTDEEIEITKTFCGAVAISDYRQKHTYEAIDRFLQAGCTTNIHYVLGRNSIDRAIEYLENDSLPVGVNAIIFLLHKPVGLGTEENVLTMDDPRLEKFFALVEKEHPFQIGFDSCTIPGIINFTTQISKESIDTCEGGRWSMYISAQMECLPCSFDNVDKRWSYDIAGGGCIADAWNSSQFDDFRSHFTRSCPNCSDRKHCMGGCPIRNQIVLCNRKERQT